MRIENLPISHAAKLFIAELRGLNRRPRTLQAYGYELRRLVEFLNDPPLGAIGKAQILDARAALCDGIGPASAKRMVAAWRGLFRFAVEILDLAHAPLAALRSPRVPQRLPVYLTPGEVVALLRMVDTSTPHGIRDMAILAVMLNCGLRVGEIEGLTVNSVDLQARTIRLTGKGGKERELPLNAAVAAALERWLAIRPTEARGDWLFTSTDPIALGRSGLWRTQYMQAAVRRYAAAAGLTKRVTPHKLRHTFATLLHSRGVALVEIQALLGHSSISSTQIYVHTNPQRLRAAVELLAPEPPPAGEVQVIDLAAERA